MAKLHELLAAESSAAAAHNAISEETMKVFSKPEHFLRLFEEIAFFDENDKKLDTTQTKDKTTSVDERLGYSFGKVFTRYLDTLAAKDMTNQTARADVILNGEPILKGLPATLLLTLESKLGEKRKELLAIPTLQSGPVWEFDDHERMYKTRDAQVSFRTKKTVRGVILVEPTKEHPAQVERISEDVPVAEIKKMMWAAMWTSSQKHDAIARLDALIIAVKKARQRANNTDIVKANIGEALANFILKGPGADKLVGADSD